jgi:hypothetical protein
MKAASGHIHDDGEITMRFLSIYKTAERNTPPAQEEVTAMMKFIGEMTRTGVLEATQGCLPSGLGARVTLSGGKVTVVDGPFTESRELVAGFALLRTATKADAIEAAKQFLVVAGEGECEIRQLFDASEAPSTDPATVRTRLADLFAQK